MKSSINLTAEDYSGIMDLCDTLNMPDCTTVDMQNASVKIMSRIFHADGAAFYLMNMEQLEWDRNKVVLKNLNWKYADQYLNYYHKINPFLNIKPIDSAFRDIDLAPRAVWQGMEYYVDFIRPQQVAHQLVMKFKHGKDLLGHLGMMRFDGNPPFSLSDLVKARCLAKIVNLNFMQRHLLDQYSDLEKLMNQVAESSSEGIIVLNTELSPLFYNHKALKIILPGNNWNNDCLQQPVYPSLPPEIFRECIKLKQSNARRIYRSGENKKSIYYNNREGNKLKVEIEIIKSDQDDIKRNYSGYAVLRLKNCLPVKQGNNGIKLPGSWNLTSKEQEVIKYVYRGLTNKEIANRLYISLPTVATHMRNIFSKLKVKNRSTLIYKISSQLE